MKQNTVSIVFGFVLVLLGISILFDNLGISLIPGLIWRLWPVILIVFGVKKIQESSWTSGLILIFLGLMFLTTNFDILRFNIFVIIWPMLIVVAGISVLTGAFRQKAMNTNTDDADQGETKKSKTKQKHINEASIFASNSKQVINDNFQGGSSVAIFGEMKLDISKCKINKAGGEIEALSLFGNTEIFVPQDMNVTFNMVPIFGEAQDQRQNTQNNPEQGTLNIKAVAVFGGVQIKNPRTI